MSASSSSSRPVYVPGHSRKRQRFHGAFTGGFSAGYFNTVGSKEGWQPRQSQQQQQDDGGDGDREQRPEDFMDEHDHDEWGGPTAIKKDFLQDDDDRKPPPSASVLFTVQTPQNVGKRLLRLLGWREGGSSAYVPEESTAASTTLSDANKEDADIHKVVLSNKRLRRIQLQQKRVEIPKPKLDHCGLGYEPFENAPEFQAHRERRQKMAQKRAQQASNVYRVSDALRRTNEDDDNGKKPAGRHQNREEDAYVSYETVEDFVGSKSVGGFALREDEDDAYDDEPLTKVSDKVRLDQNAYETVAYEHDESDDEGADVAKPDAAAHDFGGALSSWAQSNEPLPSSSTPSHSGQGVTADGRPPLPGFVLGGSANLAQNKQRFRGPDIPPSYEVKRHVFGPNDHPLVLKALSHAVQLELTEQRRKAAMEDALKSNATANAPSRRVERDSSKPLSTTTFAGLSTAMKNRFTSESVTESIAETTRATGLLQPEPGRQSSTALETSPKPKTAGEKGEIEIKRTIISFAPEPLLCKRFHVPVVPKNVIKEAASIGGRTREAAYFYDEILGKVEAAPAPAKKMDVSGLEKSSSPAVQLAKAIDGQDVEDVYAHRPSMATYKSIFEPASEESSESEHEGLSVDALKGDGGEAEKHALASKATMKPESHEDGEGKRKDDNRQLVPYDEANRLKRQSDRKSRRRKRSQSVDSSDLSDSSTERRRRKKEGRREKKRQRDKRKKKRKKKSSRRGND